MQELLQQKPEIAERFGDLHPPFEAQAAVVESNRCLNCFDAPCTIACPTHIDVPKFIKKIASGNLHGAALGILDANVLGASCARVCPVEVLCEGACVMHGSNEHPIEIGRLQRYAMDSFHAKGGKLPRKSDENRTEKIACIGAGPASLSTAAELQQRGFQVTVFDKRPSAGGLNTYGIAEYKLPLTESLDEIELIKDLGVEFRLGVEICGETWLAELEAEFDMIFIGVGLGAMHRLSIPGESHPGVIDALQFIEDYKTGKISQVEGDVVVVGAGNTAIDAANAAKRLGAKSVSILYRRTREHISAFDFEYRQALQEGVHFLWLTQLMAIHSSAIGITSVECLRMEIDSDGSLKPVEGSTSHMECNMVIPAIGQSPLLELLDQCREVQLERGRVVVNRATGQTTNPKYFAGGDCVNGGREVVDAVADGKRAGVEIARLLESAYV
ncbi:MULTISPECIES: NAD(P)-dependent oxidoreductase [Acidobacteriaceae]|uniref:NAD(P)-dependent oxidoreductase n=1 Tax=Acidobacteriaceae TaxID=204434 RepID=UPI00131C4EB9|nr:MULTISPECIES: NAD(P)-dependent oxidoreductase [Acidobacteriaceae]MDW5266443.1 NAD(P)-dependent oxidoreductase [Edaphobacter sp.]